MTDQNFKAFLRQNWKLVTVLLAALLVAAFLAGRVVMDFIYFNDPRNVDVDLKPWMTPFFVVQTYDLPRPVVFEILQLDPEADRGLRLRHVADRQGVTIAELTERVRTAAEAYREAQK
jgi:hypothetical protein